MSKQMPDEDRFELWLRERRQMATDIDVTESIMRSVFEQSEVELRSPVQTSTTFSSAWCAKCAACAGAMAIGMIPFIYLFVLSLGTAL